MKFDPTSISSAQLRFYPFILACVLAFTSCCLAGRYLAGTNVFKSSSAPFTRFTEAISAEGLYLPTFSELYQLALAARVSDRTLVIIGGDSIFYGLGQDRDSLWSESLKKELGDDYTVVNLAFRGGGLIEGAWFVFESLAGKYEDIVFVGNTWADRVVQAPLAASPYFYIYQDGLNKGFLKERPERERYLAKTDTLVRRQDFSLPDQILGSRLDSIFYFKDFWNAASYSVLSSVWSKKPVGGFPFQARSAYFDTASIDLDSAKNSDDFFLDLIKKEYIVEDERRWAKLAEAIGALSPAASLRRRMLVVDVAPSPRIVNRMSEQEKKNLSSTRKRTARVYRDAGYPVLEVDGIGADGYIDGVHLNAIGGSILAGQVGRELKRRTRQEINR
ncbi:hypothetical protein GC174_01535 [bacterium]|nr:hypothetical protein [bacterium]